MILGTACLGDRALDGPAIRAALATTGLQRVLLVARPGARPHELRGAPAAAVRCAWERLADGLLAAQQARAGRLVLDLPATLDLERAARELHACARGQPGLTLALATPAGGLLALPDAFSLLLGDLASVRVGYWHWPSRAHLLGHGDQPWLDALSPRLVGMSLDDVADGRPGALPGLGGLDFKVAAASAGHSLEVALDTGPLADLSLLRFAREHLERVGFH